MELAKRVRQGGAVWNDWRRSVAAGGELDRLQLDLTSAHLSDIDLANADLKNVDLSRADLNRANLSGADLRGANLSRADLSRANLGRTNLFGAKLSGTNLTQANIRDTNLGNCILNETILADVDLTSAIGLISCVHLGPSVIDHRTLSKPLPIAFLRGAGVPDRLIEYLPALSNSPIQYYSCFVSYSSSDREFAKRIQADLQAAGVRCWFAPEDLQIGAKIADAIDDAIRLRDKVLLILSRNSITSPWVEDEVTKAFEEERRRGITVLFPLRLDDTVFASNEAWASKLRDNRHIGDFQGWRNHGTYQKALARLIRDLAVNASIEAEGR